jgi:deoxyribodipyrimidine photo-lyase
MRSRINVFWFRRDLRIEDNTGLYHALRSGNKVMPIFIFDTDILDKLNDRSDKRVDYIHQSLEDIHQQLKTYDSGLFTYYGKPLEVFRKLVEEYDIDTVFCNRDYEPQAIERDKAICKFLEEKNIKFTDCKDQVIFEGNDILKSDGSPYTVYTPYSKKWKENIIGIKIQHYVAEKDNFLSVKSPKDVLTLEQMGFEKTEIQYKRPLLDKEIIDSYDRYRDFPAMDHTTHIGVALRFGTISVRKCVQFALQHNETWLNELIWREFFMQILFHFPYVVNHCFKKQYENIKWRNNEKEFALWCTGDSSMKQVLCITV